MNPVELLIYAAARQFIVRTRYRLTRPLVAALHVCELVELQPCP